MLYTLVTLSVVPRPATSTQSRNFFKFFQGSTSDLPKQCPEVTPVLKFEKHCWTMSSLHHQPSLNVLEKSRFFAAKTYVTA